MAQEDPLHNVMLVVYLLLFVMIMLWLLYTIGMFFVSLFSKKKKSGNHDIGHDSSNDLVYDISGGIYPLNNYQGRVR